MTHSTRELRLARREASDGAVDGRACPAPSSRRGPKRPLLAAATLAPALVLGTAVEADDPIRLVNGNDYVPFSDESLPEGGLAAEIVDRAAEILGREVEYVWLGWDEGYERTSRGEFDGTLPYFFNGDRDAEFFYSDSIYTVVERMFLKADADVLPESADDIDGQRLCSPVGYAVPEAVTRLVDAGRATREQPEDMTRCFQLLELGRVDAVLANVLQGWDKVEETDGLNRLNVSTAPWDLALNTQSVIVPETTGREGCRLVASFNGALGLMRLGGEYDEIIGARLGDTAEFADPDELYRAELDDGTVVIGQPKSYQRGTFVFETPDGSTELLPAEELVALRVEGFPRFADDDQACREAGDPEVVPEIPGPAGSAVTFDLSIVAPSMVAESWVPTMIEAFAARDTRSRRVVPRRDDEGRVYYEVDGAGPRTPRAIAVASADVTAGLRALVRGEADLLLTDRPLAPAEVTRARRLGDLSSDEAEKVYALEAFATVVSSGNPIIQLDAEQVTQVGSGSLSDWDMLGLDPAPIAPYATARVARLLDAPAFDPLDSDADVLTEVGGEDRALGLVSVAALDDATEVVPVELDTCGAVHLPGRFSAKTEEYPLVRRHYLYLPPESSNEYVGEFAAFVQSTAGQEALRDRGAITLEIERQSSADRVAALRAAQSRSRYAQSTDEVGDHVARLRGATRLSPTFRFRTGSSRLDARAIRDARRLAAYVKSEPSVRDRSLELVGFADSRGSTGRNLQLAAARAESVRRALELEGIDVGSVDAVGEDLPIACNDTGEGQSLNRRVEVYIR